MLAWNENCFKLSWMKKQIDKKDIHSHEGKKVLTLLIHKEDQ